MVALSGQQQVLAPATVLNDNHRLRDENKMLHDACLRLRMELAAHKNVLAELRGAGGNFGHVDVSRFGTLLPSQPLGHSMTGGDSGGSGGGSGAGGGDVVGGGGGGGGGGGPVARHPLSTRASSAGSSVDGGDGGDSAHRARGDLSGLVAASIPSDRWLNDRVEMFVDRCQEDAQRRLPAQMAVLKYFKAMVFSLWPRASVKLFGREW